MALSRADRGGKRSCQVRATASEESVIKLAAERLGMNVPEFIIRSAYEKAEQVLADQTRFILDDKQWKAFMAVLDRPSKEKPRLRDLFAESQVAKRGKLPS